MSGVAGVPDDDLNGRIGPGIASGTPEDRTREGRHHHLSMVARGGVLNLVGAAVGGLLSFGVVVVVTRGLGAREGGVFFVSVALFNLLAKTLELGADTGVVRAVSRDLALERAANTRRTLIVGLLPVLLASIVTGTLVWTFSDELASLLARNSPPGALAPLLRILAAFLPAAPAATVLLAATRGFGTMLPTVLLDRLVKPAIQPLAILLVLLAGLSTSAAVMAWAVPVGLTAVLAAAWVLVLLRRVERVGGQRGGPTERYATLARAFWGFSAPRGFAGLFQVAIAWVDTLMIGALRSAREAGIYTAATRYLLITTMATLAIIQVVGPKLGELMARDERAMANTVYQAATGWLVLIAWPVNLTILLFTPVLLSLFGGSFGEGGSALMIVAGSVLFATAVGPVDVVLLMAGKSTWNLANTAVAMLLNIGLNLVLIPRMGIEGAAIAWAGSILANNVLPLLQISRRLRMHPFGRGTITALVISSIGFGLVGSLIRLWLGATPAGFLLFITIAPVVYLVLLWRLRGELDLGIVGAAIRSRPTRRTRSRGPAGADQPLDRVEGP